MRSVLVVAAVAALLAACSTTTHGTGNGPTDPGPAPGGSAVPGGSAPPGGSAAPGELPAAAAIAGLTYRPEDNRSHQTGTVRYDTSPPVGGPHAPVWADCTGTVYAHPIANENAVHSLEHGAVWLAYRPGLPPGQLALLDRLVRGQDRLFLSPYPGLQQAVSVQSWAYQLRVVDAADPRIRSFVDLLRYNPDTTPEYGATCSNPDFKINPSTPGHPDDG